MFLINGTEQASLAANDRATQFGDGCFTTARIIDGQIQFAAAHQQGVSAWRSLLPTGLRLSRRWPCWRKRTMKALSKR